MVRAIVTKGAFYWLRAPRNSADLRTDEWMLASIRLLLSVCFLSPIIRPDGTHNLKIYEAVSLLYLFYSGLVAFVVYRRTVLPRYSNIWLHCADLLWAAQLICLVHWPAISFTLLLFVMASAAFRWGFSETILTYVVFCALLVTGHFAYNLETPLPWKSQSYLTFAAETLLYLGVVCMMGLLAESKSIRAEGNTIARTIAGIHLESGMEQAVRLVGTGALQAYGAAEILLVMHERVRNRAQLFRVAGPKAEFTSCELDASQLARYSFPEPGISVRTAASRSANPGSLNCLAVQAGKILKTSCSAPESFRSAHPFRLMLASAFDNRDNWVGRVYILDPKPLFGGIAGLLFMDESMRQISPAIHDLFLVGRLTTRARAAASGHVARELHDGILQSLSLINMELDELRRQAGSVSSSTADPLEHIQQTIQSEIAGLRDFTQQLRALELDSGKLQSFLAGMAVKFQCEHGIATRFVSDVDEMRLAPHTCVELARIVQEGLTNIRKHSAAREALVRFSRRNGGWVLSIMDNGRGFAFSGCRSHEELQSSGEGPRVIIERASSIRARVSVESIPNSGSNIEISIYSD